MIPRPRPHLPVESPWLGVNFWSRAGGPLMWRDYDAATVREELRTLADHGITLTRSFFHWPDFHPAPDVVDEDCVRAYLRFLDTCAELGMTTIPTFVVGHMSGHNSDVPWRAGRNLYTDGFMLGQQAFFIREMTSRLGGHPALAGWLISNEMPHYGGFADRAYVRAWGLVCTAAVRAGGSTLPVSLGDGAWTQEVTGVDNGFRLRDQLDVVDFFGPHSYPAGDDQLRQFADGAFACELTHLGKPVVLEEFGVTGAFVSDDNAAHYYRQVLHRSLLAGASGWIAWNNTDFDLAHQDPYRHHPYELGFGLTRADGTPKPALAELASFGRLLRDVDAAGLERVPTATAVVLPAHVDLDLPMVPQAEREVMPRVVRHAWLAGQAADLAPAVVRESEGVPDAPLLLLPSCKAMLGTTAAELVRRAEAGSHVYLSWFAGVAETQRGAWWPDLQETLGIRHLLRYGLTEPADDTVELTFTEDFGDLPAGARLTVRAAGEERGRAYLPLEVTDGRVVAVDRHGRPALVRRTVGEGAFHLCAYPLEYFGSARREAHTDDEVWRLYRALAVEAGVVPAVAVDDPRVSADRLRHRDGTAYTWLVSSHGEELTVKPAAADGTRLVALADGADAGAGCVLPPYGVTVLRHVPRD